MQTGNYFAFKLWKPADSPPLLPPVLHPRGKVIQKAHSTIAKLSTICKNDPHVLLEFQENLARVAFGPPVE